MKNILVYKGGIGDALILGTIAQKLAKRDGKQVCIYTFYPELFDHPSIVHLSKLRLRMYRYLAKYFPKKYACHDLYYTRHYTDQRNQDMHFIKLMSKQVGLDIDLRPQLSFPMAESIDLDRKTGEIYIGIQSTGSSPRLANKFYYPERFQEVIKEVKRQLPQVRFAQMGLESDPGLFGVDLDFRGKTSIRGVFPTLKSLDLYVGLVGFLMHASAAVGLPSVIVFGGREKPGQSGYSWNANIATDLDCSPCWAYECPINRECMKLISSHKVAEEIVSKINELKLVRV